MKPEWKTRLANFLATPADVDSCWDRLQSAIQLYLRYRQTPQHQEERYKWADLADLAARFPYRPGLSRSGTLALGRSKTNLVPYSFRQGAMHALQTIAKHDTGEETALFLEKERLKLLEDTPALPERIATYRAAIEARIRQAIDAGILDPAKTKNIRPDDGAIAFLLAASNPERYFLYQIQLDTTAATDLQLDNSFRQPDIRVERWQEFALLLQDILRPVLAPLNAGESWHSRSEIDLLDVQDFVYSTWKHADPTAPAAANTGGGECITEEQWRNWLQADDDTVINAKDRQLLRQLVEMGGQATCVQLAARFGGKPSVYISPAVAMAKRIQKFTGCVPDVTPDETKRWWNIPFLAFLTPEKHWIWQLRPALAAALNQLVAVPEPPPELPALNTIFYGPPGTGKTYTLLHGIAEKYFTGHHAVLSAAEQARQTVADLTWWEVIALCLLERNQPVKVSDILEHPLLQAHIQNTDCRTLRNAVWGQLQLHTKDECAEVNTDPSRRSEPKIFTKDRNSFWMLDRERLREWRPELFDRLTLFQRKPQAELIKRYEWVTFHQSFGYESFIEGIKPGVNEEEHLIYQVQPGLFQRICRQAAQDRGHLYALFIDEINRGNVSAIFGELITLLEADKRDVLEVKLPYSGANFAVPSNLYIVGSMNTADRSIEALDSALRRRFAFVELFPDPELLSQAPFQLRHLQLDLSRLLRKINERIEFLLDRDHAIGHTYFMKLAGASAEEELALLRKLFRDQLIPLLEDYFYGNLEKVFMVLGDGFITRVREVQPAALLFNPGELELENKTLWKIRDINAVSPADFSRLYLDH